LSTQHNNGGEDQHTLSKVSSCIDKTTTLFDSESSEAILQSIFDTQLKPEALALWNNAPIRFLKKWWLGKSS